MDLFEETYNDLAPLLVHVYSSFYRRFGGDFEVTRSEALFAFAKGYREYNYKTHKSPFSKWIARYVYNHLLNQWRKEYYLSEKRKKGHRESGLVDLVEDLAIFDDPADRIEHYLDDVSDDARTVAMLAVDLPQSLRFTIHFKGGSPHSYRTVLRQYLLESGWSRQRVAKSFNELATAVSLC